MVHFAHICAYGIETVKMYNGVKQNAKICAIGEQKKIEVFILGGQRIDQKRKKGWWRGRRERIEKGREREDRDNYREKRQKGIELTI